MYFISFFFFFFFFLFFFSVFSVLSGAGCFPILQHQQCLDLFVCFCFGGQHHQHLDLFVSVLVESCPGNQMAVISNQGKYCATAKCACYCLQSMFDLILNSGGKLDITNRQGLTPLTLAAKLARKDVSVGLLAVYKHVLKLFS